MWCAFVNTVNLCNRYHDNRRVGCEAAGVYCGLCVLFRQLDVEDFMDVFSTVRKLRKQRPAVFTSKVHAHAVCSVCMQGGMPTRLYNCVLTLCLLHRITTDSCTWYWNHIRRNNSHPFYQAFSFSSFSVVDFIPSSIKLFLYRC